MPLFTVRFQGLLFKTHFEQLEKAGIVLGPQETPEIGFGEPIYSAAVEADSEGEAIERVERAIGRDSFNFSKWEAGAA
jgi:hypothetical protein